MGSSKRQIRHLPVVMAVVVVLVVGLAAGLVGLLSAYRDGGAPTVNPTIFDDPAATSTAVPAPPAAPVLLPTRPLPGSLAGEVDEQIRGVGPVQGEVLGTVVDAATSEVLYDQRGDAAGTPASTQKVLTSLAALELYGPGHRFDTVVRRDPADPATLYLVGGGDPYLAKGAASGPPTRSSILDLAAATATALAEQPAAAPVRITVDTSLFAGPGWNPAWIPAYQDYAAETTALWVDGARPNGQPIGPRDADPAGVAAAAFTAELRRLGVSVSGTTTGNAPDSAAEIAKVSSMPVENIVELVLIYSDNDAAEVLFRHIGRSDGRSGSIADARVAMQETLTRLGAWTEGMRIDDGSGLARTNLTSPQALTRAVQLAVLEDQPRYRAVATGMSVAGAEGTLAGRFVEDGTGVGRGLVRAKTGTLTQVHSLAGYVRNHDGALLVYSFIVNGEQDEYATRVWLDRVTAALAACGCQN
jgi:D-alanyl-D-alanine carboxypeptidase/D-alanyl-D-alanine-endopeptidase (penicillin-binding protein 4)